MIWGYPLRLERHPYRQNMRPLDPEHCSPGTGATTKALHRGTFFDLGKGSPAGWMNSCVNGHHSRRVNMVVS